jgi:hypothetical protein
MQAQGEEPPAGSAPTPGSLPGRPGTEPVGLDTLDMEEDEVFDSTAKELEGVTQLEKPRVPRKIIVKSLRQNTISLKKVTNVRPPISCTSLVLTRFIGGKNRQRTNNSG